MKALTQRTEREVSRLEELSRKLSMIEEGWRKGGALDGERALDLIGKIHEVTGLLAVEMTAVRASFVASPMRRRDKDAEEAQQAMMDQAQALTVIDILDDEDVEPSDQDRDLVQHLRALPDDEDAAVCLRKEFISEGTRVLQAMIAFIWQKAPSERTMIKRMTAITRRYQREKLSGITQTATARIHGEKSRCAAVSARERDIHDEQFIRIGVRAPGAADHGLKTASTKLKSKVAAQGNSNRKGKSNNEPTTTPA